MPEAIQTCPACTAELRPKAIFCHRCGVALTPEAEQIARELHTQNLSKLEIAELGEQIHAAQTGEVKPLPEAAPENHVAATKAETAAPPVAEIEPVTPPVTEIEATPIAEIEKETVSVTKVKKPTPEPIVAVTPKTAVEPEVVQPVTDAPAVVETTTTTTATTPEKKPPVSNSPAAPKSRVRRYAKQTEYVWEESTASVWSVTAATVAALLLVLVLLWMNNFLR